MSMQTTPIRRTRTFCCCIPVRAGAIVLAIIGIIGGGGLAAIGCLNLTQNVHTDASRLTSGVQIGVYTVLALVSLFGLIGAIAKRRGFVNLYFAILIGHLLFSFALGAYAMYRTFKDSSDYIAECAGDSDDEAIIKICEDGDKFTKGLIVGVSIIVWLLEIWACTIVFSYSRQLSEEEEVESVLAKDNEVW